MRNSINRIRLEHVPAPLPRGTTDVWRFFLDDELHVDVLSRDEHERAQRFVFERDAKRYSAGRTHLRCLLGAYLDEDPGSLCFVSGPWGKPELAKSKRPLAFNVSHSGGLALIAVGNISRVGVDLEAVRSMDDRNAVAVQNFSPAEYRELSALPADRQEDAFFACWTGKEAVVKLSGEGLSAHLASIVVGVDPTERAQVIATTRPGAIASDIALYRFQPHPGFWAALAAPAEEQPHLRLLFQP